MQAGQTSNRNVKLWISVRYWFVYAGRTDVEPLRQYFDICPVLISLCRPDRRRTVTPICQYMSDIDLFMQAGQISNRNANMSICVRNVYADRTDVEPLRQYVDICPILICLCRPDRRRTVTPICRYMSDIDLSMQAGQISNRNTNMSICVRNVYADRTDIEPLRQYVDMCPECICWPDRHTCRTVSPISRYLPDIDMTLLADKTSNCYANMWTCVRNIYTDRTDIGQLCQYVDIIPIFSKVVRI